MYWLHNRQAGTQQAVSSAFKTMVNLIGATTRRAQLWEMSGGPEGTPNSTDCSIDWDIANKDATTAGTGTAATPAKVNGDDGAAVLTASVNYTAEATTFTTLWNKSVNQRATVEFRAYNENEALIMQKTASIGLGVRALSATYTGTVLCAVRFAER